MPSSKAFFVRVKTLFIAGILFLSLIFPATEVWAKRPPETRNQEQIDISKDMHARDLSGYEFVKEDLRGIDFSESDLRGAIFNNSQLDGADLHNADLEDAVAFATGFENADLTNVNFTNALLMESHFDNARIDGADFTNAVLSRIQQKQLCGLAGGTNASSGESTSYSLGC